MKRESGRYSLSMKPLVIFMKGWRLFAKDVNGGSSIRQARSWSHSSMIQLGPFPRDWLGSIPIGTERMIPFVEVMSIPRDIARSTQMILPRLTWGKCQTLRTAPPTSWAVMVINSGSINRGISSKSILITDGSTFTPRIIERKTPNQRPRDFKVHVLDSE